MSNFLAPGRLWLLVLIPAAVAVYLILQRRRTEYALRFTNLALLDRVAPRRPQWRRHLAVALVLLAATSSVIAFARPKAVVKVPRERATIVMTIDVSLSMMATDIDPTRLGAAKKAAKNFINQLPAKFNVAVVAFAGTATIVVPPTTDHASALRAIDSLQLAESTGTGEGIFAALQAITQVPPDPNHPNDPAPARIVLESDGKRTVGRTIQEAAAAAKAKDVPVYTLTIGTQSGFIEMDGIRQRVPPDPGEMQQIAQITGGRAYNAESADELDNVYQDIGSSVGYDELDREITSRFAGIAMLLTFLAGAASIAAASRLP
ncbi:Ca-activated chloride channel family protein [Kribbella aluminosa]|uniref:Ca-activated chloride channel family protein n=1 Tax=Kribbella aluminosa TaxID=416017 RepID=A0ABS4UMR3_9ACTN|nr:VWA domain-containing protein [Kribbella aluminosa]MBP2352942.1 Ca-activated chloride channel family protein [Kribbella aluminosa]